MLRNNFVLMKFIFLYSISFYKLPTHSVLIFATLYLPSLHISNPIFSVPNPRNSVQSQLLCISPCYSVSAPVTLYQPQLLCTSPSYSVPAPATLYQPQLLCTKPSYSVPAPVTLYQPQLLCTSSSYSVPTLVTLFQSQLLCITPVLCSSRGRSVPAQEPVYIETTK